MKGQGAWVPHPSDCVGPSVGASITYPADKELKTFVGKPF